MNDDPTEKIKLDITTQVKKHSKLKADSTYFIKLRLTIVCFMIIFNKHKQQLKDAQPYYHEKFEKKVLIKSMNKKVSLLVLLGCIVCIATLMVAFTAENSDLKLKKTHSFAKSHDGWGIDGYWSTDKDCQAKCTKAGGMSCGAAQQNCCVSSQCKEEKGWLGSSYNCNQRIVVDGCTKAK